MTDTMATDYGRLQTLKRMLDESRSALSPAIEASKRARRYYDGDQLTSAMKRKLKSAKQPETIRNRIAPGVDGILGLIEQSKVDPRAYPRNPQDEEATDVATKCLQFVADKNRFHKLKLDCADNHCVEGIAAAIVQADDSGDVIISQITFDEFFYDPHSKEADYSDARYMGVAKWLYADDLAAIYPEFAQEINSTVNQSAGIVAGGLSWDDDKPNTSLPWIDRKMRRVLAVEIYYRDQTWKRCVFCAAGELEAQADSPYVDEDGQPMNPIEASSCFIDADLQRYSPVRRAIPLQDELNARASRSLHLFNSRQLQVIPGEIPNVDSNVARLEASRADGLLPEGYTPVPTSDMAQGNLLIMQEVSQSLDRLFPTPAVLGRTDGSNQSGRSRLVLQQAGMTELGRALGRLEDWENRIYRQCWLRIRQFWTDQKYIRVTNDEGAPEFLQINEPIYQRIPLLDPISGQPVVNPDGTPQTQVVMQPQPVTGPDGQPVAGPDGMPQMEMKPVIIGYDNRVAEMDMDIQVESVPDTANLAAEQFDQIMKLVPIYGPDKVPFEAVLALSSLPEKRKIKDLLNPKDPQQQQMQAMQMQMQQVMQRLAVAEGEAKVKKTESEVALNTAKTQQIGADIQLDQQNLAVEVASRLDQQGLQGQ
jgi:hypothetical protein